MTTQELLRIAADRGLKIVLKENGPVISPPYDRAAVTGELLDVLKIHRERIIDILKQGVLNVPQV